MKSHYAITGAIRYYRTLPSQVELQSAKTIEPEIKDRLVWLAERMASSDAAVLVIGEATPIEGPFSFSRWKDPPHVALANLRDEPTSALRFTRTYGVIAFDYNGEPRTIPVIDLLRSRDKLRRAWDGDEEVVLEILNSPQAILLVRPGGIEIVVENLWTLVCVMFARDFWDERLKKCQSPDCPAPYFLPVRKGQKFCSQRCAVLINVRHFRERKSQRAPKTKKQPKLDRKDGKR